MRPRARADFVLGALRDADGRLLRTFKDGRASLNAYLEDHAYLVEALLTLYEATFDPRWFAEARALADTMIERFADDENGGFFETSSDHERLRDAAQGPRGPPDPVRQLERRLRAAAARRAHRRARATRSTRSACCACCTSSRPSTRRPSATCSRRWTSTSRPCRRSRSSATTSRRFERVVRGEFRPHLVLAGGDAATASRCCRTARRSTGRAAAYVCEHFACRRP